MLSIFKDVSYDFTISITRSIRTQSTSQARETQVRKIIKTVYKGQFSFFQLIFMSMIMFENERPYDVLNTKLSKKFPVSSVLDVRKLKSTHKL